MSSGRGERSWALAAVVAGTAAVFAVQYSRVRSTNFAGPDEWLCLDLASRGILGTPYADRPLDLLWTAIPASAWPHHLASYWLFHGLYLLGTGVVVALLAARLVPGRRVVALVAGVAACTWAPLDFMRLDTVLLTRYSGCTLALAASLLLVFEYWDTRRSWPLVLAGGIGFLAALGFEGALPILAFVPWLPFVLLGAQGRRGLLRVAAWEAMVVCAAALTAPMALVRGGVRYQASGLGFDPQPLRVAARLVHLLGLQLQPLVSSAPSELRTPAVAVAAVVFAAAWSAVAAAGPEPDRAAPGPSLRLCLLGGLLAALGALPFAFSPATQNAGRTQLLSAPGVALLLAGLAGLLAGLAPLRLQRLAVGLAGLWIVAVGTGRVVAMQAEWDGASAYPEQQRTLSGLVAEAPALRPGTLVVLLDEAGAWPYSFSFRHAVSYLYPGQAIGVVAGANDVLYPQRFTPEGVAVVPYSSIRGAWDAPPSFHPWSAVVIARLPPSGPLEIVEHWPLGRLPPLAPAATYSPRERIVRGGVPPASRVVLRAAVREAR